MAGKRPSAVSTRHRANKARQLAVVILAAGLGKRMRSRTTKVLHELAGKPLVSHVLDTAAELGPERVAVVVGHQAEVVRAVVGERARCVLQAEQLGTGHAVLKARSALRGFRGEVLVLCGDVPLICAATLRRLLESHRSGGRLATVLSMIVDEPAGYGRIVRGPAAGEVRIVEHRDTRRDEKLIDEVNTGLYCFDSAFLWKSLGSLGRDNAQGEYYLTDLIEMAAKRGKAACEALDDDDEGLGVNSRLDLAEAEALLQERILRGWMERGVTFIDPATAYVSAAAKIGRDTVIGPNTRLEGDTRIGSDCRLDGSSYLRDTKVGTGVHLRWGVVTDSAEIGPGAKVGPYAHLRPEAELGRDVHIGNFVEVKKSRLGRGSKANHLAYIGDATIGRDANIGAGTITCNYDGFSKHPTVIGDRVQIGSDTQLVAPVEVGNDAYIAAGSTITSKVEPGALAFNVKPQRTRADWVRAFRKRAGAKKKGK